MTEAQWQESPGGTGRVPQTSATPVAIPTWVIDRLLPRLRDTELRVLLVVLRQTWGRGKAWDWMTHSQLKRRTGRASEAISGAIDTLVRRGLVRVRHGNPGCESEAQAGVASAGNTTTALHTAAERRRAGRYRAHLLFAPGPVLGDPSGAASVGGGHVLVAGKPKTTKVTSVSPRPFRFSVVQGVAEAQGVAEDNDPPGNGESAGQPVREQIRRTLSRIGAPRMP